MLKLYMFVFLILASTTLCVSADPYQELGRATQDTVMAVGFALPSKDVPMFLPEEPEDPERIQVEDILWKHLRTQERLKGCVSVNELGVLVDVDIEDVPALRSAVNKFVADSTSWREEDGLVKNYSQALVLDEGRLLFGTLEAVKAYPKSERLSKRKEYAEFPARDMADSYIHYFCTNSALAPQPDLLELDDPRFQEALKALFGKLDSYPDLAIVSNNGDSKLMAWGGPTSGLVEDNARVVSFYRDHFITMSLRTRIYVMLTEPMEVMVPRLDERGMTSAKPLWKHLKRVFDLD